jgi:hypothetical protein
MRGNVNWRKTGPGPEAWPNQPYFGIVALATEILCACLMLVVEGTEAFYHHNYLHIPPYAARLHLLAFPVCLFGALCGAAGCFSRRDRRLSLAALLVFLVVLVWVIAPRFYS